MSDDTPPQPVQLLTPPSYASVFGVLATATEVTLVFGNNVPAVKADGQTFQQVRNWHSSVAISPTAIKVLADVLPRVIADYEKKYGAIPRDPGVTISMPASVQPA